MRGLDNLMDGHTAARFIDIDAHWREYDVIEFWADPDPDAQLVLLQFLDWFARRGDAALARLHLVQSDDQLGERGPDHVRTMTPRPQPIGEREIEIAVLAWGAFCRSTPERWAALLNEDLTSLPWLSHAVVRLLEDLPQKATGLGATKAAMLTIVACGDARPPAILRDAGQQAGVPMLDYWQLGKVLDGLAAAPEPAVLGLLEGPFDLAMHDDPRRFEEYRRSRLALSAVGLKLASGDADFLQHGRLDRWWGATRLTNGYCWRWDAAKRSLIGPP